ncbi:MAG: mechanosensitive ion channel family protein [Actinomycetota bacterium]|nr:mechanosensitive ion channel family protein [Actinomycetota bacterium]
MSRINNAVAFVTVSGSDWAEGVRVKEFIQLLIDVDTVAGRAVTTAAIVLIFAIAASVGGRLVGRRLDDPVQRYYGRKAVRYLAAIVALIGISIVWRAFAGRVGVVLGLFAAGVAFAMQEVIGAAAGWFNIVFGRIFGVGDRIEMGGVRGDVIDVSLLRTKILEIGSDGDSDRGSWVKGRQHTGRVVAVSNKATFTEPVFNYTAMFDYIWEELMLPVSYRSDWHEAERILREEAEAVSRTEGAEAALRTMSRRYPVPRAELEPRVFVRNTDNWVELAARFVVPARTARTVKDAMSRRVRDRFDAAGIEISSETFEQMVHFPQDKTAERHCGGNRQEFD